MRGEGLLLEGLAGSGGALQGRGNRPWKRVQTPDWAGPTVTVAAPVCQEEEGADVGPPEPWWNRQPGLPGQA